MKESSSNGSPLYGLIKDAAVLRNFSLSIVALLDAVELDGIKLILCSLKETESSSVLSLLISTTESRLIRCFGWAEISQNRHMYTSLPIDLRVICKI